MGLFFDYDDTLFSDVPEEKSFGYQDCKNAYTHFSLGKRLVNSLPRFALSSKRVFSIPNAPEEVVKQFEKTLGEYNYQGILFNALTLARVYGMSAIVAVTEDSKFGFLSAQEKAEKQIVFNVLDPMAFHLKINQDPSKMDYLKPSKMVLRGKNVDRSRCFVLFNGNPLYLDFQPSNFNFGGQSVFANMENLMRTWQTLLESLERIAVKAGSILITNEKEAIKNPLDLKIVERAASLFKAMKKGAVAELSLGKHAEFFNLNGASEIAQMISEVKQAIAIALDDTPSAILMDKELSNGLSEGREDMKAVVMAVENYRSQYVNGVCRFLDSYLFHKAWNDDFINDLRIRKGGELPAGIGNTQLREAWIKDFTFTWESVYPKTPDEETKEKDGLLDRVLKLKEVGGSVESIEETINDSQIFKSAVVIEKQETQPDPFNEEAY